MFIFGHMIDAIIADEIEILVDYIYIAGGVIVIAENKASTLNKIAIHYDFLCLIILKLLVVIFTYFYCWYVAGIYMWD